MPPLSTGQEIIAFLVVMGIVFLFYIGKRVFSPYRCTCGKRIYSGHGILRHVSMKHFYDDPHGK